MAQAAKLLRRIHDVDDDPFVRLECMGWLAARDEGYAAAFAEPEVIRAAIDQEHVEHSTPIAANSEIAFFPPVTGG